jgi:FkbM family methyltransferase
MLKNLAKLCLNNGGSISPSIIPGDLVDGTGLCNSSIFIDENGDILLNLRHVHYSLYHSEFEQKYYSGWGCLAYLNPENDICLKTGNYLCKLDPDTLYIKEYKLIDTSKHDIKPIWEFIGLEDARIFRWEGKLYVSGVRRDIKDDGEGRMELCELFVSKGKCKEKSRLRIEVEPHTYLEKNWMPILDMPFHYVRWANPLEIVKVDPITQTEVKVQEGKITTIPCKSVINKSFEIHGIRSQRGGSQVIPFGEYRMAVTHECDYWINEGNTKDAKYYHRFIFWDKDWNLVKLSEPFKFMNTQIEFSCGLAYKNGEFYITYGFQDNAAYVLRMPENLLDKLEYVDLDQYTKFECKYPEFSWDNNEPYLSKIINDEIFVNNIYTKHFKVKEGDVVMDIGANVGAFSFEALQKNIKHLYSIEPSSLLLPTLTKNLKSETEVDIINLGIGNEKATDKILSKEDSINIYDNINSSYNTTTFSQLIEDYKIETIDFLKCDCEGGEYFIFTKENEEWIKSNVKKIAGEFHLWGVPSALDNFYIFRDLFLKEESKFIVEDRQGKDVTSHMKDDEWLKDFSWSNRHSAQLNVYIDNVRE